MIRRIKNLFLKLKYKIFGSPIELIMQDYETAIRIFDQYHESEEYKSNVSYDFKKYCLRWLYYTLMQSWSFEDSKLTEGGVANEQQHAE